MDRRPFSGSTALVTGGARRLGRVLALRLAALGCDLVVHHHDSAAEAFGLASELQALGVQATVAQADLREPAAAARLVEQARKQAGRPLRFLVNNASDFPPVKLEALEWPELEATLRLDAWAPFALTRAFVAQAPAHAAVVNLLDTRIADYDWEHAGYYLAKRMLADLTRLCAVQFAPKATVNGVAPGPVKMGTDLDHLAKHLPMRKLPHPDDVADAALYLLGAPAVTGQVLHVDGGRHLGRAVYG
ncbi:MAG: hypothetical protein QOD77_1371 [Thermoplasmata archaeon]|nr:hypothetical protein [Thermoplasmata archaeon]